MHKYTFFKICFKCTLVCTSDSREKLKWANINTQDVCDIYIKTNIYNIYIYIISYISSTVSYCNVCRIAWTTMSSTLLHILTKRDQRHDEGGKSKNASNDKYNECCLSIFTVFTIADLKQSQLTVG